VKDYLSWSFRKDDVQKELNKMEEECRTKREQICAFEQAERKRQLEIFNVEKEAAANELKTLSDTAAALKKSIDEQKIKLEE